MARATTKQRDRKFYSCHGKTDYGSWQAAERVAKFARRKGRNAGGILFPFHCKTCGGFHLASSDGVERESRRRNRKGDDYGDDDDGRS